MSTLKKNKRIKLAKRTELYGDLKPTLGNQITRRGKAKYLGGNGRKTTGISRRAFKKNLQRVRVTAGGTNKTMRVCTQCIRSGAVTKRVRNAPFKLPAGAKKATG